MDNLLDTTEKRALLFLRLLYAKESWWTEKELSKKANCTAETTFRTLNFLKEFSLEHEGYFTITTKKNRGIYLEATPIHSLDEIESFFIKRSLSFRILDALFQNQYLNHQKLATLLFVSPSTIYRKIKKIQQLLNDNGLFFDQSSFAITGPEWLVREFFFRFYWAVIKAGKWPFHSISFFTVQKQFRKNLSHSTFSFTQIEKVKFCYYLAINHVRQTQHKFITDKIETDAYTVHFNDEVKPFISVDTPISLLSNEVSFLSLILVSHAVFDEHSSLYLSRINEHKRRQSEAFIFSNVLLKDVQKSCPIGAIRSTTKLLYRLIIAYQRLECFSKITLLESTFDEFINNISTEHAYFYQVVVNSLNNCQFLNTDINTRELLYNLLLIFSSEVNLDSFNKKVYVKLACTSELLNEHYLMMKLQAKTTHSLIIHTSSSSEIPFKLYDLLITDNQVKALNYPEALQRYVWNFPPTNRDWQNILTIIENLAYSSSHHR